MKKALLLILFIQSTLSAQHIERVEPSNWWIGMKEPMVQLLVHGNQISDFAPSFKYKGVKIEAVHKTENPNYLFLDLIISKKAEAGIVNINFANKADKETFKFELKARRQNSAQREGFNTSDAIYLITPDRFANGNPNNDNVDGYSDKAAPSKEFGRHGGDIQGITEHLDYISDMGFTAIWPMPLEENNMDDASYHGYAITDFYKIDPRYGSNQEYYKLSAEGKKYGVKLIKDVVLNHCGSNHWWMKDLPSKDWINYEGNFKGTNHRREVQRDIHASQADTKVFSDGWFVSTMPDMNQRNPFLANYLIQNSLWWIEMANLDGLRVDTYPYSDQSFSSRWSKRIMEEYPNFNITSEEWSTNPAITSYWQRGKVNANGYQSYVPTPMDFPLQDALVKGLNESIAWGTDFNRVYQSISNDFQYADASSLLIFADNHDMSRIYTQLHENYDHFKMAMVLMATMRGIPQFYYGTEILMTNPNSDSHGEIRGDFPGGFENMSRNAFTAIGLSEQQKEAQNLLKTLLNYRKSNPVLHTGKLIHFGPENGVYVYFRHSDAGKVMVILNKNEKPQTLDLSRFRELLPENSIVKNVLSKETLTLGQSLELKGSSATVFEF
ncbi:glycoside hydrolase family 13 protein [Arcticibacterium luteifluviistationis]|uniref:Alpha-amlyase n=1 Tax=Arcticibacterium luteifluviistationis TaxID=1784714 RepID=A0A2Z4GGV9_9BACT|nr:glycoside hydrolase family 13 protein [Arcticibacterium luteifluviistationis]AWW00477.1 alpha-amlyase [Arcticibacterium luteifluviistationis]